jgi:hypothetical protein
MNCGGKSRGVPLKKTALVVFPNPRFPFAAEYFSD